MIYPFLILLVIIQGWYLLMAFDHPMALLSAQPVLNFDYSLIQYWLNAGREFFFTRGALWGYDPFYMAGFPLDHVWNNALPVQVLAILLRPLPVGIVVKIFLCTAVFSAPLLIYLSLRNLRVTRSCSLLGALLGTVYFHLGLPSFFIWVGMITACLVSFLSLYLYSRLLRYLQSDEKVVRDILLLGVMLVLLPLIHKTSVVILLPGCLVAYGIYFRRLRFKSHLILAGLLLLALAVNAFWLVPFFDLVENREIIEGSRHWTGPGAFSKMRIFLGLELFNGERWIKGIILILGIVGIIPGFRRGNRSLAIVIIIAIAYLFGITYLGVYSEFMKGLDPYRYVVPGFIFLLVPAGWGLETTAGFLREKGRTVGPVLGGMLLGIIILFGYSEDSFLGMFDVMGLSGRVHPQLEEIVSIINERTDNSGRIMIEDSGYWDKHDSKGVYHNLDFTSLLSELTKRQFIGGPYAYAYIRHHRVDFQDGRLLEMDIDEYNPGEIREVMKLYNIKWILCWSDVSRDYLNKVPGYFKLIKTLHNLSFYEVMREGDFFLKGEGKVEADYNRIGLKDLRFEEGELVIKYHWQSGLTAGTDYILEPHPLELDPIGFIRIKGPPRDQLEVLLP